ncbi:MAG: CBS domain-containing protein [Bacteroidetes bacterium]|nr:CBS domain-containing protein [Bacteroidota bacterium]
MLASELVIEDFPTLSPADTIKTAGKIFIDNAIAHLAVVNSSNKIEGILPADVILTSSQKGTVADFHSDFIQAFVFPDMHALDVFEIVARLELSILPAFDLDGNYIGTITTENLLQRLSTLYSFKQPGGIIEMTIGQNDLDVSNITHLVEDNNAKVILMYMDTDEVSGVTKLTMKLNTMDVERIVATLQRFNYKIDFYRPSDSQRDEQKERYAMMMKLFDL